MICPKCGVHVQDGLDTCPACNTILDRAESVGEGSWCASCGSFVPAGTVDCPVCGLPLNGAFDAEDDPTNQNDPSSTPLLSSAIPPAPEPGDEGGHGNNGPSHTRLVFIAAITALVLVGGGALFITRPWDPNAYITHATEDADTSMEGFPGTVTHLSAQDHIEDAERSAYLKEAQKAIKDFKPLMVETADRCTALEGPTESFLSTGIMNGTSVNVVTVNNLRDKLREGYDSIKGLDMRGSGYEEQYDRLTVTASYLMGRMDTLCGVWEAISNAEDAGKALVTARSAASNGAEGRSLEEWRDLYNNAYAGFVAGEK